VNYLFEDVDTGERVEEDIPYRRAPGIGKTIKLGRRTLRRLPSIGLVDVAPDIYFRDNGQLPANYKYHLMAGGKCDEKGFCLFDSAQQIRETEAMANAHGERINYTGRGGKSLCR
jgi:hypothetical protein